MIGLKAFDVVAGEGAEESGALTGTDVPAVVALLQDAYRVAILQFQFVVVLRGVRVKCSVPARQRGLSEWPILIRKTGAKDLQNRFGTGFYHDVDRTHFGGG